MQGNTTILEKTSDSGSQSETESTSGLHPSVHSGDLGRVVLQVKPHRSLTDNEKFYLLKHHFVPAKGFQFPNRTFGNQKRQFQASWLERYNGLTYSPSENGGYCLYCVLFGTCEPTVKELGVLVNRSFINIKKAIEKLNEHFVSQCRKSHQLALEKATAFLSVQENRVVSIDQQLNSKRAEVIQQNRLKLRSIAATVILCGHQGFAFRGHDEDRFDFVEDSNSTRLGNFLYYYFGLMQVMKS